jgi:FKBP-type peptidyl-prolyl cis-trans isomerase
MKKLFVFALCLSLATIVAAQTTKPAPAKPKPVTPATKPLKTFNDSASYAIGVYAMNLIKQQGLDFPNMNAAACTRAINDITSGKAMLLDEGQINNVLNTHFTRMQQEKAKPMIDSGNAFLARNKKRPGVITTPSGLQYEIVTQGTGIKPTAADTFVAHYRGTLLNGTEFDASYNRGQPLTLGVGQVIKGWTEGLQLMPIGSKYKFYIPYNLAYGVFGQGEIPGGAMLVFEVELLDVKKAGHP